ncbi:hypothetical protein ERJ75_001425900 [Trypanosoma vivax]|nr:hypothetical protein ERJ75_001425900 [Trypanosoma vivax]
MGSGGAKKGVRFRPVLLEAAGSLSDACCRDVVQRLRCYRNRYAPILRLMTTTMAPSVDEQRLFGSANIDAERGSEDKELLAGGQECTVGVGRSKPVEPVEALVAAPHAAVVAEKKITVVRRLHEGADGDAVKKLETFMAYHFLPLALLHNLKSGISLGDIPLILRHYVHEATRTASFLVVDRVEGTAAVIDPQVDISCYVADILALQVRPVATVLTHCFVDIAMGHCALLKRYPDMCLLSCAPFEPRREVDENGSQCMWPEFQLSARLALKCVPIPSFSPECSVVELHLDGVLIALFTGTVLATDAVPRHEFFDDFPSNLDTSLQLQGGVEEGEGMKCGVPSTAVAQQFLKERVWDRYLFPEVTQEEGQILDHVVVFPSHGGYSNVTHQLDLYWAVHIGDLKRMKHSRTVLNKMLDSAEYNEHARGRPSLPKPSLMTHVREWNLLSVPSAFGGTGSKIMARRQLIRGKACSTRVFVRPIVVDVRDADKHVVAHLKGSVNVPMTFPATAYGVKKAELWLQCILRPLQPIVVVCAQEQHQPLIRQRLALISPDAPVEVYTDYQLQAPDAVHPDTHACRNSDCRAKTVTTPLPVESQYLPPQLIWVCDPAAAACSRLACYQELRHIEPGEDTLVLDCRTPYEFRNGSHNYSVHLSLAELCRMTSLDEVAMVESSTLNERGSSPTLCDYGPSTKLGSIMLRKLDECATACGIRCQKFCYGVNKIIVYCAAGYRSLIAASLMRRAFEAAVPAIEVEVYDVVGGALRIMQQRPDLWTVKDRSIICIS